MRRRETTARRFSGRSLPSQNLIDPAVLLGEDELALAGFAEAVDLALVLDPDLVAAAGEGVKAYDLRQLRQIWIRACSHFAS